MKYIVLPEDGKKRGVPFYFAVEEYVSKNWRDDEYFLIWQVDPCVMVGRNQLIDNEVNVEYCKENGIDITRRKSGGGCIYSDGGCLLYSYLGTKGDAGAVFERRMRDTARTIEATGVKVEVSGRNDLLVDGKKVAGAALYHCGDRIVMHNSLLYDTNFSKMQQAITPSRAKLESKGVESVSSRVGNVGDYTNMSMAMFVKKAREVLCKEEQRVMSEEEMREVHEIERYLSSDEFIYGFNPRYSESRSRRIEGVGTIEVHLGLRNNKIEAINMTGDYFLIGDIDGELFERLKAVEMTREDLYKALSGVDVGNIIKGLTMEELIALLIGETEKTPLQRKPSWLRSQTPSGEAYIKTQHIINEHGLHTICSSGRCPNRAECWRNSTATFMICGDVCTRCCRFCNTATGRPLPLDEQEPMRVAQSIKLLGLKYAVITSVDRDDLTDMAAQHWAATVEKVHEICPETKVEVLIPDFQGRKDLIEVVLAARPDVVGHNMETTRRLTPSVRSVATYERSLEVLRYVESRGFESKTGFMLGLGENEKEIEEMLQDIYATGCRRLTIGQYLQPTHKHLPVRKYYTPEEFVGWRVRAREIGFKYVVSGPLVRSSYHAADTERNG